MIPTRITLTPQGTLVVMWDDGHSSTFTLQYVRDLCPCAACREERINDGALLPILSEGKYRVNAMRQVGSYAIGIEWGDGHNLGIYSFEYLRSICPCPEHARASL